MQNAKDGKCQDKNVVLSHFTDENTLKSIIPEVFIHPMAKWRLYSDFENWTEIQAALSKYVRMFGILGLIVLHHCLYKFYEFKYCPFRKRAKEVGVRKAVGSGRKQLIRQFLSESMLISALAFLFALVTGGNRLTILQ